jgi:K+-transporting ATPase ATPase A chain
MTENSILQIVFFLLVLLVCVKPLGLYMARVYEGKPCGLNKLFGPVERLFYRVCGINPQSEMNWKTYAVAVLVFNLVGFLFVYALQRFQGMLPLNPQHFMAVPPDLAFNTAISYVSNTNWQGYGGESTMSYLTQMFALAVQNFLSAATGLAILIVLIRGFVRRETNDLGNFWVDMLRSTLYILLPLATILALVLVSQGVIQNFKPYQTTQLVQPLTYQTPVTDAKGNPINDAQSHPKMQDVTVTQQTLPMGPVASQVAIEQLGTNGGGFFNVNDAHPYQNPTPLSNFLEMLALLLIPVSLCYTFGVMVGNTRQGWAIFLAMIIIFIPLLWVANYAEQKGNPAITALGVANHAQVGYSAGNMEGKETRFGITSSTLFASVATATSTGAVNSAHDSYTPLGGMIPMVFMQLGEVVFGGVGSGLYGMLMMVIIAVFIAGLMVGRTPEYLGKKIEPFEMKMASLVAVLLIPVLILVGTALGVLSSASLSSLGNPGAHGFSEILYAFTSMANNNGSAFSGLNANTPFYNLLGGLVMFIGRYWVIVPILAIAGSLVRKKVIPPSLGTLPTTTPLFIGLLIGTVIIVGALTYLPALALGPIVEHFMMG